MNRCKNCRHFGEELLADPDTGDDRIDVPTGYHICNFVKHAERRADLFTWTANAAVEDGSGYFAQLVVKDDFGCVNFEPLPTGDGNG